MTSTLMMVWIMCCGHPKTWSARLDSNQRVPSRASAPIGVTNQPSLLADMKLGAPWRSRTTDRMLRRHVLYPAELMAHLKLVRETGFEPATSSSRTMRSTRLSYTLREFGGLPGNRTQLVRIKSPVHQPLCQQPVISCDRLCIASVDPCYLSLCSANRNSASSYDSWDREPSHSLDGCYNNSHPDGQSREALDQ